MFCLTIGITKLLMPRFYAYDNFNYVQKLNNQRFFNGANRM